MQPDGNGSEILSYSVDNMNADARAYDSGVLEVQLRKPIELAEGFENFMNNVPKKAQGFLKDAFSGDSGRLGDLMHDIQDRADAFIKHAFAAGSELLSPDLVKALLNAGLRSIEYSFWDLRQMVMDEVRALSTLGRALVHGDTQLLFDRRCFVRFIFDQDAATLLNTAKLVRTFTEDIVAAVPAATLPPHTASDEFQGELIGTSAKIEYDRAGNETQWYLHRCRALEAWTTARGKGVIVADIDSGFYVDHSDFDKRLDGSRLFNSVYPDDNVSVGPWSAHGTAVLGILGAAHGNRTGIVGFTPDATLWLVQAATLDVDKKRKRKGNSWANAIEWVCSRPETAPKVILLEAQTALCANIESIPSIRRAIRSAIANGVVVCVPAGNGGRDAALDSEGSRIPETGSILVGATRYDEHNIYGPPAPLAASNWGRRITVWAPGDPNHDITDVYSVGDRTLVGNLGYTSGAAPKVAGTIALMLEANPSLEHDEIREILYETGEVTQPDKGGITGRFLNTSGAVAEALRRKPA